MSILAIIPARGGSKRVPDKNKKILAGKPLIAHTIKVAQMSKICDKIVVSTDSQEIADIALHSGADVPWLRSAHIAEDTSDVIDAVIDIIERYKKSTIFFDSVLLLQPTSPFRKLETIQQAVKLHKSSGESVVSVNAASLKPSWYREIDEHGTLNKTDIFNASAEDVSSLYILNGSIYISSVENILAKRSFYSEATQALVIDKPSECLDIDTFYDWILAEKLIELKEEVLV